MPGGLAFKAASGLGKATILAKQAGKYAGGTGKLRRFTQGSIGAGIAEGIAVGDVQDAGTFGDFLGGPTKVKRGENDPATELMNRLKFGVEGMAFTGAFGAAGKLVSNYFHIPFLLSALYHLCSSILILPNSKIANYSPVRNNKEKPKIFF